MSSFQPPPQSPRPSQQQQQQQQQLVSDEIAKPRLDMIRSYVAKPIVTYLESQRQSRRQNNRRRRRRRRQRSNSSSESNSNSNSHSQLDDHDMGLDNSDNNDEDYNNNNNNNNNDDNNDDDDDDDDNVDPQPAWIPNSNMYIGNRHHAANIQNLQRLHIVAVLNCASGGISRLPVDELQNAGIHYAFTNCRQDHFSYPILHDPITGVPSSHLITAKELYATVRLGNANGDGNGGNNNNNGGGENNNKNNNNKSRGGNVLFFCVAGQNRSPALALAVLMLFGHSLDDMCQSLAQSRPFVLENVGFQWQLIELEYMLLQQQQKNNKTTIQLANGDTMYLHGTPPDSILLRQLTSVVGAGDGTVGMDDEDSTSINSFPPLPTLTSTTTSNIIRSKSLQNIPTVEIELLIPGLCTMEVHIPIQSTIAAVKERLVDHANKYLVAFDGTSNVNAPPNTNTTNANATSTNTTSTTSTTTMTTTSISKSWVVLAMFGYDSMYDFPLEVEAIDLNVQIQRMKSMFHLTVHPNVDGDDDDNDAKQREPIVEWTAKCRFALVILAVRTTKTTTTTTMTTAAKRQKTDGDDTTTTEGMDDNDSTAVVVDVKEEQEEERPWTFVHEERPGAPATLLKNTPMQTNLRAWDFVTGQAYASERPIVFSFSPDGPRDKRSFMKISTSANEMQQFHEPGEGGILGMGANAIVHRVKLKPTSTAGTGTGTDDDTDDGMDTPHGYGESAAKRRASNDRVDLSTATTDQTWDAAVKRPFGLAKMLAFLENSSEAGMAKRLRFANALNSDGRILYFYGLGVGMSANAHNLQEYKWEVMLLARYEKQFSAYTLRRFMEDYIVVPNERTMSPERKMKIERFQNSMSLISVKLLLVNLLNAFRDLTLMGVQAFDFNHLNNVLVSRDSQTVQLIDIDGNSKGSIQFPSEYIQGPAIATSSAAAGGTGRKSVAYHKPSLDIDLNTVLPTVVEQLILGKGRGNAFTTNKKSEIWRADPAKAKELIKEVVMENFFLKHGATNEPEEMAKAEKVVSKVAEWFYAMVKRQYPWDNWTHDVYDALRCIDHLPIA